jgi:hypothetical protein
VIAIWVLKVEHTVWLGFSARCHGLPDVIANGGGYALPMLTISNPPVVHGVEIVIGPNGTILFAPNNIFGSGIEVIHPPSNPSLRIGITTAGRGDQSHKETCNRETGQIPCHHEFLPPSLVPVAPVLVPRHLFIGVRECPALVAPLDEA